VDKIGDTKLGTSAGRLFAKKVVNKAIASETRYEITGKNQKK
jgi:hypothetical protein